MREKEIGTLRKKKLPQILSNLKKGNFFRTSYQFFKDWEERSSDENVNINPMEKMGVYCIVFSLFSRERSLVTLSRHSFCGSFKVIFTFI
jgi:hypothetical protein